MTKRLLLAVTVVLCAVACSAQTAQPLFQPYQTFVNNSGHPCAGCSLYSYAAGTTTPQATYTDSSKSVQNPNPVVLNASGSAAIWMGSSAYKFVLIDTFGTTLWTVDNVLAPIGGASGPFLPLTGGTLTGSLTAPYFQFSSNANACTSGQFVSGWSSSGWTCSTPSVGGTAGGDLSGTYPDPKVVQVEGGAVPVSATLVGTNSLGQLISQTGTIGNSTTGNAATATAFAAAPSACTTGQYVTGISANGTPTCSTPGISGSVQSVQLTSGICTTGNTGWAQCSNTITWPNAFPDTNYALTCTAASPSALGLTQVFWTSKTTTGATVVIQNGDTSAANPITVAEIDCIGMHN